MIYYDFAFLTKTSYGRYAHSGTRVRPKTRKNEEFGKRGISLKNNSPDAKTDLWKQSKFDVWRLILSRYNIFNH